MSLEKDSMTQNTIDERVTNLEIKLSFAEDLIENLNETIYKQ